MNKSSKRLAMRHCANWDTGKCLGALIRYVKGQGLITIIDSDMHGKECFIDEECSYFENTVKPGIPVEKTYERRRKVYK